MTFRHLLLLIAFAPGLLIGGQRHAAAQAERGSEQATANSTDGGVTIDNAYSLTQGGIDVLNAGGAIQKAADPQAAYATLVQEINKHGVI